MKNSVLRVSLVLSVVIIGLALAVIAAAPASVAAAPRFDGEVFYTTGDVTEVFSVSGLNSVWQYKQMAYSYTVPASTYLVGWVGRVSISASQSSGSGHWSMSQNTVDNGTSIGQFTVSDNSVGNNNRLYCYIANPSQSGIGSGTQTSICDDLLGAGTYTLVDAGAYYAGSGVTFRQRFQTVDYIGTMTISDFGWVVYGVPPTATATSTPVTPTATFTPTSTPLPGSVAIQNYIQDGDMEQFPVSDFWYLIDPNLEFGRANDESNFFWSPDLAPCGNGYQYIGEFYENEILGYLGLSDLITYGGIEQDFTWDGGGMVINLQHSAAYSPIGPQARFSVVVHNVDTNEDYFFDDNFASQGVLSYPEWHQYISDPQTVPAGDYVIRIDDYGEHEGFNHKLYFDDVVVAHQGNTIIVDGGCSLGNEQATLTPTATSYYLNENCDFESGSVGWLLGEDDSILDTAPVGPVGDHYLQSVQPLLNYSPTYSDPIAWEGGTLYITTFMRSSAFAIGGVSVWDETTSTMRSPISQVVGTGWGFYQGSVYLAPGTYRLLLPGSPWGIKYDGVSYSANGFVACSGSPTLTPTATKTPTATVTGTPPTATRTRTPTNTSQPQPTRTPRPTLTPRHTYTPQFGGTPPTVPATNTQIPTHTQSDPEKTATAQGTAIGTYTPYPTYTPYATSFVPGPGDDCPGCELPDQPANGPGADCVRPRYFWEVAQWVDYARCDIIAFFSWSDTNTQQLQDLSDLAESREPFGTAMEVVDAGQSLNTLWQSYDWINTGYVTVNSSSRPSITALAQSALSGETSFAVDTGFMSLFNEEYAFCHTEMLSLFSDNVAGGVCTVWTFLHITGIREWIQFFWDLAAWALFFRYGYKVVTDLLK